MSSSCVWAMSYWDAWDEPVTECLDPLNEKGFCPCEPYCEGPDIIPCFRDADEWELVAVPKCLKARPNETGSETCLPDQPVASTLEAKPRKQWTLRLKSVTDYKMSAICAALRGLGVDYEAEEEA